ncbi:hypothetical protein OKW49_008276 [Paraburkholderia youngii]
MSLITLPGRTDDLRSSVSVRASCGHSVGGTALVAIWQTSRNTETWRAVVSINVSGTEGYAENAQSLVEQWRDISFEDHHKHIMHPSSSWPCSSAWACETSDTLADVPTTL